MQIKFNVLLAFWKLQLPFKVENRRLTFLPQPFPVSYQEFGLGVVAHTCNPSTPEAEAGGS